MSHINNDGIDQQAIPQDAQTEEERSRNNLAPLQQAEVGQGPARTQRAVHSIATSPHSPSTSPQMISMPPPAPDHRDTATPIVAGNQARATAGKVHGDGESERISIRSPRHPLHLM